MSFKYPRLLAVFAFTFVCALPLSLAFALDARAQSTEEIYQRAIKFYKQKNYTEAASLYRKAAKQGEAEAQNNLGFLYAEGQGVKQDYGDAAEWWRKAAEQGNAEAQYNLGILYNEGRGVLEDYQKASEWYHKAAGQGYAKAFYNLSIMYINGHAVKKDLLTAYALLLLAVKEGDKIASENINTIRKKLTTEQIMAGQEMARKLEQRIEANKQLAQ